MKLSPRHAPPISRPPARRRATVLMVAMLVALCLPLSGCQMEMSWPGYNIENYSSSNYVARNVYASGTVHYLVVPPESSVGDSGSAPVKVVVYDASCLAALATVTVTGPNTIIYIDEAGHISTSRPKGPLSSARLPNGRPGPAPSTCPGLHAEPTNS
jgi:hypothetical protein